MGDSEEKGAMQTNKKNGDNSMALYFGRKPPWPFVDPHGNNMSPNHRWEAAVVRYVADWTGGRGTVMEFFAGFKAHGFMKMANANEFLTRSHGPIWDRIFLLLLWAAIKKGDGEMVGVALQLLGWYVWLSDRVRVPTGPMMGRRVTVNGRFAPWSGTSDCVQQVIKGEHILEPKIIANGDKWQDDFGARLASDLVQQRKFIGMKLEAPPMPCDYSVAHFEHGHATWVPEGSLEPGDPAAVSVEYISGQITKERRSDLGKLIEATNLQKVVAA